MQSEAGRELNLSLGGLAAVLVLSALVSINLLQRMPPRFTDAFERNVATAETHSQLFGALASASLPGQEAAQARSRYRLALERAEQAGAGPATAMQLATLREAEVGAFSGEPLALHRALQAMGTLQALHQTAAQAAEADTERLGRSGGWAIALLGASGFALALFISRRLYRHLVLPLLEVERVLGAAEQGDRLQRCGVQAFPNHQRNLLRGLNRLLDAQEHARAGTHQVEESASRALAWLLDGWGGACALVTSNGELLSASSEALDLLAASRGEGLRASLTQVARGGTSKDVECLRRSEHWSLLRLGAGRPAGGSLTQGPATDSEPA